MEPGRVIEFIEGGKFVAAVVCRVKGTKLNVLTEGDREISISQNRVQHEANSGLNPTKPRSELVRQVKEIAQRRAGIQDGLDLQDAWELLDGEGEEFSYEYLAELIWPTPVAPDQVAAVQRAVFADGLRFKMGSGVALRQTAEKVEQILLDRQRGEEREREMAEGGAWLGQIWKDQPQDEPACADKVVQILKDMALYGAEASDYKLGQKLLERADLGGDPWRPYDLLVKMGEFWTHENLDLIRERINTSFSDEVLAEAEARVKDGPRLDEGRRDLTGLEVITADSGGARDFDDAVSLEEKDGRLFLGVHIADVSALIPPQTLLDREALERGTAVYMPDQRIPMLPEILSEECLSLKEGLVRPAFSMLAELTETGDVLAFEFFPSLVRVKRQLSYQEVDETVQQDLTLKRMLTLSQALKRRRVDKGAMILPLPKLNVYITPEGEIGVNLTLWENPGRAMITEFMILANHLAARFLTERGAACFYRIQDEPNKRIVPGDTDCADLFACLEQRRYLTRVTWTMESKPHHGMGLDCYTNLTSPLRRYLDLVMQRQVRSVAQTGQPFYSAEDAAGLLTQIEEVLGRVTRLQVRRRRYWLLHYFRNQGSREYEALVLERHPRRWRIFLTDLMMDADLPQRPGLELTPGQVIHVRAKKVVPRDDLLRFDLA